MSNDGMSDEDKALFRAMMKTVKPLGQTNKVTATATPRMEKKASKIPIDDKPRIDYNLSNY